MYIKIMFVKIMYIKNNVHKNVYKNNLKQKYFLNSPEITFGSIETNGETPRVNHFPNLNNNNS